MSFQKLSTGDGHQIGDLPVGNAGWGTAASKPLSRAPFREREWHHSFSLNCRCCRPQRGHFSTAARANGVADGMARERPPGAPAEHGFRSGRCWCCWSRRCAPNAAHLALCKSGL